MKGERVVAPALLSTLVGAMGPVNEDVDESSLTVREREVLALLAEGQSNREIASSLYVSLPTVKTHLAHIYAKLGAKNRNEALGRAVALGLLG
jgi:ATP/maltotriose-dependent transcriptional regulator MalT